MAEPPQEEPQTALPRVLQEVRPHGTAFNGEYAALWVFLTYAALYADEWIMLEGVVRTLKNKYNVRNRTITAYVICREIHSNPADPERCHHLHILLKTNQRFETSNGNWWDLPGRLDEHGERRRLHPYIVTPNNAHRDIAKLVMYITKDGYALMNLGRQFPSYQEEAEQNWGQRINECTSQAEAENMLRTDYPTIWYKHGPTIITMLANTFGLFEPSIYSIDDFTASDILAEVVNDRKSLVMTGASGTGKTELAIVMAPSDKTLLVCTIDDLKNLTPQHTKIVFDDFNCNTTNMTFEEAIHLADLAHSATVRCRYRNVTIPAGMPRVFTTNLPANEIFPTPGNDTQKAALERRLHVVEVTENLFA